MRLTAANFRMLSFGPELVFDGCEQDYINADRLQRIVKFMATGYRSGCSTGEMLNALIERGVEPDDRIVGIYKVSPSDSIYSVLFKFTDVADQVVQWAPLHVGKSVFETMKLNEQVINVRVHWLPLFFENYPSLYCCFDMKYCCISQNEKWATTSSNQWLKCLPITSSSTVQVVDVWSVI